MHNDIFGIDLGTTYSSIAHVDSYGKPTILPNSEGEYTTPSVVLFDESNRIVGREAKNSAVLTPGQVVQMVKRQMGEPNWRFSYEGTEISAEEISSYILRKLAKDAENATGTPVKDVVITCPAYFGIVQREATKKAGALAGLNVRDIINEPTAAAIMYGLQEEKNQTVLVYDLGGGTFDITIIDIRQGEILVVSTGGDYNLGGRDWDEAIVRYLAEQWQQETGSTEDPLESEETLQDLWVRAEEAKKSLSGRPETRVVVAHAGRRIGLTLSRHKFNELTNSLLEQTILFTKHTIQEAQVRGYKTFDHILLVGGSTRMPQVEDRLKQEFQIPLKLVDPEYAIAKGAAIYGHKLVLGEKIKHTIALMTGAPSEQVDIEQTEKKIFHEAVKRVAQEEGLVLGAVKKAVELKLTNVSSHSFGIVATDTTTQRSIISNIVLVNEPLPASHTKTYVTEEEHQATVEIIIIENSIGNGRVEDLHLGREIGNAVLHLPHGLPQYAPIQVSFTLQEDGTLHMSGHEPTSGASIAAEIQTANSLSAEEFQEARKRATVIDIS